MRQVASQTGLVRTSLPQICLRSEAGRCFIKGSLSGACADTKDQPGALGSAAANDEEASLRPGSLQGGLGVEHDVVGGSELDDISVERILPLKTRASISRRFQYPQAHAHDVGYPGLEMRDLPSQFPLVLGC
jgi:hypothetical protein